MRPIALFATVKLTAYYCMIGLMSACSTMKNNPFCCHRVSEKICCRCSVLVVFLIVLRSTPAPAATVRTGFLLVATPEHHGPSKDTGRASNNPPPPTPRSAVSAWQFATAQEIPFSSDFSVRSSPRMLWWKSSPSSRQGLDGSPSPDAAQTKGQITGDHSRKCNLSRVNARPWSLSGLHQLDVTQRSANHSGIKNQYNYGYFLGWFSEILSSPKLGRNRGLATWNRTAVWDNVLLSMIPTFFVVASGSRAEEIAFIPPNSPKPPLDYSHNEDSSDLVVDQKSKQSVHLQLVPTVSTVSNNHQNDNNKNDDSQNQSTSTPSNTTRTIVIHSLEDTAGNTWKSLNLSPGKFVSFLRYRGVEAEPKQVQTISINIPLNGSSANIQSDCFVDKDNELRVLREEWRQLWKQERLITDRTELLAVYPSEIATSPTGNALPSNKKETFGKRGGFSDHLCLYVDRFIGIVQDERELTAKSANNSFATRPLNSAMSSSSSSSLLFDWLEHNYNGTMQLISSHFSSLTEQQQYQELKRFLEWFRSEFPYYYDRCSHCGASMKEDIALTAVIQSSRSEGGDDTKTSSVMVGNQENCNHNELSTERNKDEQSKNNDTGNEGAAQGSEDDQSFLGYIYPNATELLGKASRTELYQCHKCRQFTRFPRYNAAFHVIDSRRGRCGEYSVLLWEFLRALGHEVRWVVDWADHVWAEILWNDRWVHLDPCEAAVDENFIYQGWGKKQTYIIAFNAPRYFRTDNLLVEDVTRNYSTEKWAEILKRREEPEDHIEASLQKATAMLRGQLDALD